MEEPLMEVLREILKQLTRIADALSTHGPAKAAAPAAGAAGEQLVEVKAASIGDGEWGARLPEGVEGEPGQRCRKVLKNGDAFTVVLTERVESGRYGETWRTGKGGGGKAKPSAATEPRQPPLTEDDIPF